MQWQQANYSISTDKQRLDLDVIHGYLRRSYWSENIPLAVVQKAIAGSLCFGLYHQDTQMGFARVITDGATFGYLADVFVLEAHRGKGLSKWLLSCIQQHPELQGLRRMLLTTKDAHGLYQQFGFTQLGTPERLMECHMPNVYQQPELG